MLAITVLFSLYAVLLVNSAPLSPPKWGAQYIANGSIQLPYAGITEPFKAWVDLKRSRIDYYKGMNIILFDDDGKTYKIVPTSEVKGDELHCYNVTGLMSAPQSVVPDISQYKKSGSAACGKNQDSMCDVYTYDETNHGLKSGTYSFWVDSKTMNPVKFDFIGRDYLFGSHSDHYIIEYDHFEEVTRFPMGIFDVAARYGNCTSYPGPGASMGEMNPMYELVGQPEHDSYEERNAETTVKFNQFKKKHQKQYQPYEELIRKNNFRFNLRLINSINRASLGFKLAINHLTDTSISERKIMRGYKNTLKDVKDNPCSSPQLDVKDIPMTLNWTKMGSVTPVKDQGICGSCWSFGTTGTLEGRYANLTGMLVSLSEQTLVDCTWEEGNNGCDGGETFRVFNWFLKDKKNCVPLRSTYAQTSKIQPGTEYLMADGFCHFEETKAKMEPCIRSDECRQVGEGDEKTLGQACAQMGPIEVAIDASRPTFSFYASGVFYDPDCKNGSDYLDHSVLLVGYGNENDQDYWLVKNSWSTYWGDYGYVKMSKKDNNCGVATAAVYAENVDNINK